MRISICFLASHALAYGRGRPYDYIETQPWKNFLSSFNHNKKRMTDSVKKVKELPREVKKFDPFGRGKKGDAILQQAKDIGASILDPNQDFQQSIASLRADDRNLDMMMKTMKTVDFEKLLVLNRREESKKRIEVTAGKAEIEGQMEKMEQQIKDFHDDNLADLKNISTQLFSQRGMAGLQERLGRRIDDFGSDLQHLQINTEREYSKRHRGLDRYWTQLDNLVSEMPGKDMSVSAMVRTATEVGSELLSKVKAQIVGVQQKGRQVKQQVLTNLQSAQSRAQTRLDEQLGLGEKKAMEFEKDAGAATQFEKAALQTGERQMGQTAKQVQRSIAKLRSS
jgi:predicted ester cyclase